MRDLLYRLENGTVVTTKNEAIASGMKYTTFVQEVKETPSYRTQEYLNSRYEKLREKNILR